MNRMKPFQIEPQMHTLFNDFEGWKALIFTVKSDQSKSQRFWTVFWTFNFLKGNPGGLRPHDFKSRALPNLESIRIWLNVMRNLKWLEFIGICLANFLKVGCEWRSQMWRTRCINHAHLSPRTLNETGLGRFCCQKVGQLPLCHFETHYMNFFSGLASKEQQGFSSALFTLSSSRSIAGGVHDFALPDSYRNWPLKVFRSTLPPTC